jgi:hypothetical protein
MKNIFLSAAIASVALVSCGTVQSIVQNTVPYTTNVLVSSGVPANQEISTTSSASSFAQYVGAGNSMVQDIRISSAKVSATSLSSNSDLGIFKSIKVYLSGNNTQEILVAQRIDIGNNIGNTLNLDPDNSKILDEVVKSGAVKARVAYVLKNTANKDTNLNISLRFTSVPVAAN